jgi:hypothetical protein
MFTLRESMRSGFSVVFPLLVLSGWGCHRSSDPIQTRPSPLLGSAASFAVLGSQTVTNTGPTVVSGDLGVSPGAAVTGFPPGNVSAGMIHAADAVALQARDDANTAYIAAAGQPCGVNLTGQDLGGLTLVPGVYCFDTSAQLTGPLVLDTRGDPNAVFLFQIGSTLTTASGATVSVRGGSGCNVSWQVGSSATIGVGTQFVGDILALTSITLTTGASLDGRALAHNGAVTMDTNRVGFGACTSDGGVAGTGGPGMGGGSVDAAGIGGAAGVGSGGGGTPEAGGIGGKADVGSGGSGDGGGTGVGVGGSTGTGGKAGTGGSAGYGGRAAVGGSTGYGGNVGVGGSVGGHCNTCTLCGDTFVNVRSDHDNCGTCGNICSWDSQCVAGACTCMATTCGTSCVKLGENPENCGACGNVCAANQWCDRGSCTGVCDGTICASWCTDLQTDNDACGACGHHCGPVESCEAGVCVCAGMTCGSVCVDTKSSASDCGACGHACGADQCCTNGQCVPLPAQP